MKIKSKAYYKTLGFTFGLVFSGMVMAEIPAQCAQHKWCNTADDCVTGGPQCTDAAKQYKCTPCNAPDVAPEACKVSNGRGWCQLK